MGLEKDKISSCVCCRLVFNHCLFFSFSFLKFFVYYLFPVPILISIFATGNSIRACHTPCHHTLALELDIDLFMEVLEPLVGNSILEQSRGVVDLDDSNSPLSKRSNMNLDCEKVCLFFKFVFFIFPLFVSMS